MDIQCRYCPFQHYSLSVTGGIGYDVVVSYQVCEIPDSIIEAARVDGANNWNIFGVLNCTVKPIIAFVLMMGLVALSSLY